MLVSVLAHFPLSFWLALIFRFRFSVVWRWGMNCINARFDTVKGKNCPRGAIFELASLDRGKVLAFTVHHIPTQTSVIDAKN